MSDELRDWIGLPVHKGHFYLRGSDGMMIGVLNNPPPEPELSNDEGEVWVIDFIITKKKRYKRPREFDGLRADQMLTLPIKAEQLEPIE